MTTQTIAPLTAAQKSALQFLTGPDGAEARDGATALEIADVIVNAAQHGVAARVASQDLRGPDPSTEEQADLDRLLGRRRTSQEYLLLRRTIGVLLPQ